MDPHAEDHGLALRTHIRELLLEYALAHLATNYVAWTQESVSNLLSDYLVPVPLTVSTSVALPVDPFEFLSQKWGLLGLDIYEEHWEVGDPEALTCIRRLFAPPSRHLTGAESSWQTDNDVEYDMFSLAQPLSPILTTHALRETPRPGQNIHTSSIPHTSGRLLSSLGIQPVDSLSVEDVPISIDDALGNKYVIDSDTHKRVLDIITSLPAVGGRGLSETRTFQGFLRSDSPPPEITAPEMVPVFSRCHRMDRLTSKSEDTNIASLLHHFPNCSERLSLVKVEEDDDGDLADEHLVIVNGWHAFKTPSSPSRMPRTPSLGDSSSDFDELMMPSSEVNLEDALLPMEEYEIPRIDRIGGACTEASLPGHKTNISAFLSPFLRPVHGFGPRIVHSPKSQPSSPRTTITASMLGQPPSVDLRPSDDAPDSDDSIAFAVKAVERACGDSLGDDDTSTLIIGERLDEKDSLLMDVPIMRPPNEHAPGDIAIPTRMGELVAPTSDTIASSGIMHATSWHGCLKKAKGLQPLQIELSWIPFKYGRTIPTDEEVADVANDSCPQLTKEIDMLQDEIVSQLAGLLDETMVFSSQPVAADTTPSMGSWAEVDDSEVPAGDLAVFADGFGLILAQGDRRRLAGLPPLADDEDNAEVIPSQDSYQLSDSSHPRPTKRVRFQDDEPAVSAALLINRNRSGLEHEDSGVFFLERKLTPGDDRQPSSFAQLAHDSEGFDGPDTDGNLFLDIDPVHFDDYSIELSPSLSHYHVGRNEFPSPSPLESHHILTAATSEVHVTMTDSPSLHRPVQGKKQETDVHHAPRVSLHEDSFAQDSRPSPSCRDVANHEIAIYPAPLHATPASAMSEGLDLSARRPLADFLAFCGKAPLVNVGLAVMPSASATVKSSAPLVSNATTDISAPQNAPPELLDAKTWVLPAEYELAPTVHRYMASMDLIEKRALVRALSSYCSVDLIEREHLGEGDNDDVHLIVDCDSAVLYTLLETLPGRGDALVALLTRLSWRYSHLLVIFKCYPSAWDYKDLSDRPVASVWSPPAVKAVRKLRRDLSIAEGLQTKRVKTVVEYAFANTVEEAAAFARIYGDVAEARDSTRGAVWGERPWLTHEERDEEYDLCGVDGMNLFAASLLLSQTTIEDFLQKSADDRFLEYGELVGTDRIIRFNTEMLRRLDAIQLPPSSPLTAEMSSSSNSIPYLGESDDDVGTLT